MNYHSFFALALFVTFIFMVWCEAPADSECQATQDDNGGHAVNMTFPLHFSLKLNSTFGVLVYRLGTKGGTRLEVLFCSAENGTINCEPGEGYTFVGLKGHALILTASTADKAIGSFLINTPKLDIPSQTCHFSLQGRSKKDESGVLSAGTKTGIALASIVAVGAAVTGVWLYRKRRNAEQTEQDLGGDTAHGGQETPMVTLPPLMQNGHSTALSNDVV